MSNKRVLECSSRGDKRFSALYAKVLAFGVRDTIENHYQKSKRNAIGGSVCFCQQKCVANVNEKV